MTAPHVPYAQVNPSGPWNADLSHLKTLSICHYVWGGLLMLISCMFIFHIVMGILFLTKPGSFGPDEPESGVGWLFIAMGSILFLLGWTVGILTIISGRRLGQQRSRVFSLVMAGINCLSVPFGTTLGVFTFIVLLRPSVQALYDQNQKR